MFRTVTFGIRRVSYLALAFAAAHAMPQAALQLPELPVVTCDSVAFAVLKAIDKHVNATVVCHPDGLEKPAHASSTCKYLQLGEHISFWVNHPS